MPGPLTNRSVFVVHGRNETLRRALFEFLRSIDLAPMEWTRAVELTGVGSPYIGQVLDAAFERAQSIVVLQTPDEIAYLQPRYGIGFRAEDVSGLVELEAAVPRSAPALR